MASADVIYVNPMKQDHRGRRANAANAGTHRTPSRSGSGKQMQRSRRHRTGRRQPARQQNIEADPQPRDFEAAFPVDAEAQVAPGHGAGSGIGAGTGTGAGTAGHHPRVPHSPPSAPCPALGQGGSDTVPVAPAVQRYQTLFSTANAPKWRPYEHSTIGGVSLARWLYVRACLLWPMQLRLCPWANYTIGEALVAAIAIGGCIGYIAFKLLTHADLHSTGNIASYPFVLVFLTVPHNSLATFLLGLPFERALLWHKLFACIALALSLFHAVLGLLERGWQPDDSKWITGVTMLTAMLLLFGTSVSVIRRSCFQFFHYSHFLFLGLTAGFGLAHGAIFTIPGIFGYVVDVLLRYGIRACMMLPREAVFARHEAANVVHVRFKKGRLAHRPGQYIFLCVPSLSMFEWHPFSIASAPHEEHISVYIRVVGDWTSKLFDLVGDTEPGSGKKLAVWVEGPVGEPSVDIEGPRYRCVLLISGGIGITPMQCICNSLMHAYSRGRPLVKVWFVWVCRDRCIVAAMKPHKPQNEHLPKHSLPLSFAPDVLAAHRTSIRGFTSTMVLEPQVEEEDPFHTEYYLTRPRARQDQVAAAIDPAAQEHLRFGRPNTQRILAAMRDIARTSGEARVAVLTCGPVQMLNEVQRLCWDESKDGVVFDFHKEQFHF